MQHQPNQSASARHPGGQAQAPVVHVASLSLLGVTANPIDVKVTLGRGHPAISITGIDQAAVQPTRDRLSAAIRNTGLPWLDERVAVIASPAELPKPPGALDLPIALGLLALGGSLPPARLDGLWALGELKLNGDLRPVRGVLPAILRARQLGGGTLLVPAANLAEVTAQAPHGVTVLGARTLGEVVAWLRGTGSLELPNRQRAVTLPEPYPDLADVAGRPRARRALEIAAAGGHHLLLVGAHGNGRSMLARRLPGLLPDLTDQEAMEILAVRSAAGLLKPNAHPDARRPFRAPHHSQSPPSLTGSGRAELHPGDLSLAHHGVLFLDELEHYPRNLLETLRQPLERGVVQVVHRSRTIRLPARLLLVAAATPDPDRPDRLPGLTRLNDALAGLGWGRVDVAVDVPPLRVGAIEAGLQSGEPSAAVRERVTAARARQHARARGLNANLPPRELLGQYPRNAPAWQAATTVLDRHPGLTLADLHSLLRVARTIADLAEATTVTANHVAEAASFLPIATANTHTKETTDPDQP